jgi:hypothetical protein
MSDHSTWAALRKKQEDAAKSEPETEENAGDTPAATEEPESETPTPRRKGRKNSDVLDQ